MKKADIKQVRTFGWGLSGLFLIIGLIKLLTSDSPAVTWHFYVVIAVAVVNFVFPLAIFPLYKTALFIAHYLGWFNTRLLLGLIFFLLFTPLAFIFKILGKDFLDRKIDKNAASYWQLRPKKEFDTSSVERQF